MRHHPFWLDRFPKSRRPSYPRFRGDAAADVVIVGGGLTGCACALTFAAAGIRAIVLEADRIGAGATAGSPGLLREDFDASFGESASAHGLRTARAMWQGMRRATLDFAAALRRLRIRCDLEPGDLLHVTGGSRDQVRMLRREYQARRDAGLEHSWVTAAMLRREAALDAGAAIRTRGFVIDPFRACIGLASGAAARGTEMYEQTLVKRVRAGRKQVEVVTDRGRIRADAVVIAGAGGIADLKALRRHLRPEHGYAVVSESLPAAVRRELGRRSASVRDSATPPHFIRWLKDDRVLVAGADQPPVPRRLEDRTLVQRTGQLMYELSTIYPAISGALPEWSWRFAHEGTVDGLPYIGTHRNFPRHLFALGHGRHGAGVAWLAARLLLRTYLGEPTKGDEAFGFSRIL